MKYIVAACQPNIAQGDKAANLKKALAMIDEAVEQGAKVTVFPEYFLTWPPTSAMTKADIDDMAETIPGPSTDAIAKKCVETGTYCVCGTIIEKCDDGKLRNTSAIIGPDGKIIGKYHKAQPENAPAKFEPGSGIWPGNELPVFETPLGRWAIMVDMDFSNLEIPRVYGLKGADVIFAPVCWSAKFVPVIETLARASGLQSHAYIVASNPVGWRKSIPVHAWAFAAQSQESANSVDLSYGGGSCIALGNNLIGKACNFAEGIAYAVVDSATPSAGRANDASIYPFWRRPDLYSEIVKPETAQPWGTSVKHDVPTHIEPKK
ncbi:MAG: carbon-nitrogen hydrolase family protein [Clostridiales Family XIII bacterium]|nr:carbon-nitrogen hydrolase family protein [Clostridiales Family XIII bacterium]